MTIREFIVHPNRQAQLLVGLVLFLLLAISPSVGARKTAKKKTPPAPELTPEKLALLDVKQATFTYDPAGRQDPFRPFIDFRQLEKAIPSDPSRPLTPLEKYALAQYHLVGIVLAGGQNRYALVEDPEGIGYTVRIGDLIGKQSARVKEISENRIEIEQPYLDIFDHRKVRTITILLRELEEENPLTASMLNEPQKATAKP
jgi:type IV pilus assembly protein PilP